MLRKKCLGLAVPGRQMPAASSLFSRPAFASTPRTLRRQSPHYEQKQRHARHSRVGIVSRGRDKPRERGANSRRRAVFWLCFRANFFSWLLAVHDPKTFCRARALDPPAHGDQTHALASQQAKQRNSRFSFLVVTLEKANSHSLSRYTFRPTHAVLGRGVRNHKKKGTKQAYQC